MCISVAFAFYLLRRISTNDLLKLLMTAGVIAAGASMFLVALVPRYGLGNHELQGAGARAWVGIFREKNTCGIEMTYLILPVFFVSIARRYGTLYRVAYALAMSVIIIMSRNVGAAAFGLATVLFALFLRFSAKLRAKERLLVYVSLVGGLVAAALCLIEFRGPLLGLLGKDATLTGRIGIWAAVIGAISKRPFLGYGFMGFWHAQQGESVNAALLTRFAGLNYAENGVLELWLGIGVVGVILYAFILARAIKHAIYCYRRAPSNEVLWYISILFLSMLNTEGNILEPMSLQCLLPFVAYAGLRNEAKRVRHKMSTQPLCGAVRA
jgi:O-antigen ligase